MNAEPYIPPGPLDQPPGGFYKETTRRWALCHVLRGVLHGEQDERVIDWLIQWDDSVIRTICSLIARARQAEHGHPWSHRPQLLGQVIADAIAYRNPSSACMDCDLHPANLCDPHAADCDRVDAYLGLARELAVEVAP